MSNGDKDLIVAKKNIFSRILSSILNKLKWFFTVHTDNEDELNESKETIAKLEGEIERLKDEQEKADREIEEIEEIDEIEQPEEETKKEPEIEDISLHLSTTEQDWTKQYRVNVDDKQVDYKEKVAPNGNKSAYYAINGLEILSMIENERFTHIKLVNYHFDTKIVDKFGVPMKQYERDSEKDSYLEEYVDYENKRRYKKEVGPILDEDENVLGDFKIIEERYEEGSIQSRTKTEQNIKDIETGELHKIFEERVVGDEKGSYYKKVDGKMVYRESLDYQKQETMVELFDKEGNVYQTHKYNKEGELIATYDEKGTEVFDSKIEIVDGKEEIYNVPKATPGFEKIPDLYDIDVNPKNKEWTEYNKAIRDVGVDFKVPEDYFFEYPMNGDTKDIVAKAKAQIKEIEKGSPKMEMKKEDKGMEME